MAIQSYSGTGKKKNHKYQCSDCYRTWVNKSSADSHTCKGNPFENMGSPSRRTKTKRRAKRNRNDRTGSNVGDTWYPFEKNAHLRTLAQRGMIKKKDTSKLRRKQR